MKKNKQLILIMMFVLIIFCLFFFSNYSLNFVRGNSMLPTFGGCTLIVSDFKFLPKNVVTGSVVIVDVSDKNLVFGKIAHRVVSNNPENRVFSTRGDNDGFYDFPSSIDGFFSYDKFLGKVVWFFNVPVFACEGFGECSSDVDCPSVLCVGVSSKCVFGKCLTFGRCLEG